MKKQDSTLHADVGGRLKYHRNRKNFTIEALAEKIEVTPRYIQDVERGKVGMSLTTLKNFCEVLEISADSILFGESAGIDSMLRCVDRETIEYIEDLVKLQLKIIRR